MNQDYQSGSKDQVDQLVKAVLDRLRDQDQVEAAEAGQDQARVVSAVPLTREEMNRAKSMIKKRFKGSVSAKNVVDASILGGLIIEVGDQVIDLSLRKKLEELKARLCL